MKGKRLLILTAIALLAAPIAAQTVSVDDLACVPLQPHDANKNHALVTATVGGAGAGSEVRLYFRRLNGDVEDFYYSVMMSGGGGSYWGVLPDPEDHEIPSEQTEASFWQDHQAGDPDKSRVGSAEDRDWLGEGSADDLSAWLKDQKSEPVEYFAALYDGSGNRQAESEMKISSVREDCRATLDTGQIGEASNQTIGETATWQNNQALYHWECDHLVSRFNYSGVKEADAVCRACVVAIIPFWIPATVAAAALGGIVLCGSETGVCEEDGSPSQP